MKQYLVIGLGRVGTSVAKTLYEAGENILGIDVSEELVQDRINNNILKNAIIGDASDGKNLKDINFKEDNSFNDVTFSYDKNDVLKNINLILRPNTITALVGPSGSGKTTIAYLLGRFWDIQKGSIKIGDIDIKDIDVNYLLSNISYVFQDIFMLTDTIFENIKMGLDKTKEEVYQAAKDAEIH